MSKGDSGHFDGTRGSRAIERQAIISSLPKDPNTLLRRGWQETSNPNAAAEGHRTFLDPVSGLTVRFDKAKPGEPGNRGKNHYHVKNPESTNKRDQYLDASGNPCAEGSQISHIFPRKE